ncbi:beta-lactamase family protein [Luteolibacter pohnpeiensis]|uniref:Beta-lactamase family protein n=1 Tax=Luteolibacter pohnpeiensis TaxID=454153 RepID=A0A934S8H4_9BACT|nr:serine hydrolase domain-containing protein [Luteolibacter pohnpeiensis]MBK1880773.1 beta-lactamase family protein [Luteolibacter pohnpeiensis]
MDAIRRGANRHDPLGWAVWQGRKKIIGWHENERGPALSITKTIAGLAITRAIREGWMSCDERVSATFPEWQGSARKSKITVQMLLQQTSGLESGVIPLYRSNPANKGKAAVSLQAIDEPGLVFRYGPSHWEVLAELIRRKLTARKESFASYLNRSVLLPIGMSSPKWRADQNDIAYLSTGAEFSIDDLGRLGQTLIRLLNGENASGFKAEDFSQVTRPSSANSMFGGGLWRNSNRSSGAFAVEVESAINQPHSAAFWNRACLSTHQPADFTALIGSGGRRLFLWPQAGKSIARLGSSNSWSDLEFLAPL